MTLAAWVRELLGSNAMVVAPGACACITARLIERAGFAAVSMTGAGTAASLRYPDFGLVTMSEMVGAQMLAELAATRRQPAPVTEMTVREMFNSQAPTSGTHGARGSATDASIERREDVAAVGAEPQRVDSRDLGRIERPVEVRKEIAAA